MELEISTIYCRCDDFLISVGHKDDSQATMSAAEVMTTALTAAFFFQATMKKAFASSRNTVMPATCFQKVNSTAAFIGHLNLFGDPLWK